MIVVMLLLQRCSASARDDLGRRGLALRQHRPLQVSAAQFCLAQVRSAKIRLLCKRSK
jgi:hypothetical protein